MTEPSLWRTSRALRWRGRLVSKAILSKNPSVAPAVLERLECVRSLTRGRPCPALPASGREHGRFVVGFDALSA